VLIAACDHPFVADAVGPLLDARTGDGAVAVDVGGRRQHLLCVVATSALRDAVAAQRTLTDLAAHRLLEPLDLAEIALPPRATHDIDSWHDREVAEEHPDE
jgi:molybdopterin-guanine dinucleotide biosynthesis protein A